MTDEKRQDLIAAYIEERRGYEIHGNTEGVKAVNAELARLGAEGKPKAKRSQKRVTKAQESR